MHEITPQEVRALAHSRLGQYTVYNTPQATLLAYPWDIPKGPLPDQSVVSGWNISLDPRSCHGRLAMCAAMVEKHWPGTKLQAGEVLQDALRHMMLHQVHTRLPRDPSLRDEWLSELLMYEEPHSVILVEGNQFDPLSTVCGQELQHLEIRKAPIWEYVACGIICAQAILEQDGAARDAILDRAELICPGTQIVQELRVSALVLQDRIAEAVSLLTQCNGKRYTARGLFELFLLTNDWRYAQMLAGGYTEHMLPLLKRLHPEAVA